MNINDKIKQILIEKNLSPSHFADEIGVQRSSISHILSGRNRPSFDIIQKIIRRFPDLGFDWILEEEDAIPSSGMSSRGNPPTYSVPSNTGRYTDRRTSVPEPRNSIGSISPQYAGTGIRSQRSEIAPISLSNEPEPITTVSDKITGPKTVERILIFYSDGTFKEYSPV